MYSEIVDITEKGLVKLALPRFIDSPAEHSVTYNITYFIGYKSRVNVAFARKRESCI